MMRDTLVDENQSPVIIDKIGGAGIIRLNKPSSLNALNLDMIRIISSTLKQWEDDDSIKAVFLEGEGERAFCAGGDIKATYMNRQEDQDGVLTNDFAYTYFKEEYDLDLQLHNFSKPLCVFMSGITMGGGFGLAAPCDFRIVSEDSIFAMPEVGIGLYPDVGAIYFLSALADSVGTYLSLTGSIIKVSDILRCEFANYFVMRDEMQNVKGCIAERLSNTVDKDEVIKCIKDTLVPAHQKFSEVDDQSIIEKHIEVIRSCFDAFTVQDILAELESSDDEWAQQQAGIIKSKSPHSLVLTLEYLKRYVGKTYAEVLENDLKISMHCMAHPDYYEGVRAQVIDKDKNPQWKPSSLDDVDIDRIASYFN